ncbi:hypothetical protein [[Eubacterium] cellulosolvens]
MKTYVSVLLSSDGANASNITEILGQMGFISVIGSYDFVYDWKDNVTTSEVIEFLDTVHQKLKGLNIWYNITTV